MDELEFKKFSPEHIFFLLDMEYDEMSAVSTSGDCGFYGKERKMR